MLEELRLWLVFSSFEVPELSARSFLRPANSTHLVVVSFG